jgi:hypothetical protein
MHFLKALKKFPRPANTFDMMPLAIPEQAQRSRQTYTEHHIACTQRPFQRGTDVVQLDFKPLTPIIVLGES